MEKKLKLAVMGAGKWQLPIYQKAKEMGIETHGFAYVENSDAKDHADYFYPVSLADKERIVEMCREIGVDGVVTCASDFATEVSCWVAEKLGLTTNPYSTVVNIHDKAWVREKTGHLESVAQPLTVTGRLSDIELPVFPCIVKPVHGNGKRGVWMVDTPETFEHLKSFVEYNEGEDALAEQYISGKEYSVESLSYHGKHQVVQVTEKMSDGAPHFVELGHHQPAQISDVQRDRMVKATTDILTAVGYINGASHIELKVTESGEIYLIDFNPRGGGDYISTHLVPLSTNCDYTREIINIALDRYDSGGKDYENVACAGVYFLTKQTEHLLPYFMQDLPCVVQKEFDTHITESTGNNDRSGFMIYRDDKKLTL